ncbi:restriction endonuclease subunit S [Citrobacter portucalensis]|uniref:restriction endonuclease subunit S n=1 Tax=Citrobacter portucalensis TaxID=1639133 RepID=UPI001A338592|nr:restriction endonuclease subunit S [Citrobacter portucalensis]
MSVDNKVPEIRFKGFGGEWKTSELSGLALFNPKAELPENFKYVDLESVKGTSLIGYKIESIDTAPSRAQRLAQKGDVFYQTVRPYQKNNYLFHSVEVDYVFSTGYAQLRPYFNDNFLLNLVQRDSFVKDVLNNCTGTSYPAINASTLATLGVSYPKSEAEQTRIGNYFQKLDELINQHQQKHDKLNSIKKAMLEKMFPKQGETMPEIRFKGFTGEWKTSKLSELALFNPKAELPESFKYVDLESVKGTSLIGYKVESRDSAPSRAQRLAQKGDVFYQTVRPYQKNNYLFDSVENDYVFSTGYAQLRPYFNGNFLLNVFQRDSFIKNVLYNCTGTSYPAINASTLATLEVSYPKSEAEQTQIGNYFQKLDALINQHQQQITKLNNIKQACLSKMFV